jgi:hypothetical protein
LPKSTLIALLAENRSAIISGWRDAIAASYPADSAKFLTRKSNQFSNPVGHAIRQESEAIFDALLEDSPPEGLAASLDHVIRIRAVQEFTPADAVRFIYLLKDVIHKEIENELKRDGLATELLRFESRIDQLALMAFDIYMACREQLYRIRAGEIKKWSAQLSDSRMRDDFVKRERSDDDIN